jgi:hypothetical protein
LDTPDSKDLIIPTDESVSAEEALSSVFGSYKAEWLQERVFDFFTAPNYLPELLTARPAFCSGAGEREKRQS